MRPTRLANAFAIGTVAPFVRCALTLGEAMLESRVANFTHSAAKLLFDRCVIRGEARQVIVDGQPAKLSLMVSPPSSAHVLMIYCWC